MIRSFAKSSCFAGTPADRWTAIAAAFGLSLGGLPAEDAAQTPAPEPPAENALPRAYPEERYLPNWIKSPFMREAAPTPAQAMKSFSRDYFLSGYVEAADETIVYLKNQKTGDSIRLTSKGGNPDFRLVALNKDRDPASVHAVVEHGAEKAEIGFDPAAVAMPTSLGQGMADGPPPQVIPGPAGVSSAVQQPAGVSPPVQQHADPAPDPEDQPTGPYLDPAEQRLREQLARQQSQANQPANASEPMPPNLGRRRRILPEPLKIEIRDP